MLVLIVFLAGCSSNETTSKKSSKDDEKKQTSNDGTVLRFATWDAGKNLKIQQQIAKKFEEKNPGVKVQVEAYGDGFDQKLAASFGAKNPPDVMYMWNFPSYYKSLEPLDELAKKDPDMKLDDFYQGLFNYSSIDGKLYGMPAGFTTRVIYYNKKLFDKANIPYPKDGWTWDEFVDTAKKLTDASNKQYGFALRPEPDTYDLQGFIWSNGSSFVSEDGKQIKGHMNSPETIEVMKSFQSMLKDKTAVLVGGKNQQSGDDIFKAGKLAMWESGIWPLEGFKDAKIDFGTVEPPAFKGKPVKGLVGTSAVSIAKDAKHKELAWEFVKFYSSPEAIKMRTSDLPVRISVVKELKKEEDANIKPFYTMLERSTNTPAFLLNPKWDEVNRNLSAAINAIMLGQDPEQLLNKAVQDSEKYMDK
ncbi:MULTISPECIES: ABC transporter substrate-binding protein [Bacillus]|uniref:Sugar ABC transporter substrate-binding protein n=1 Tax=Bacillus pseudomycoides TaxID=64104 RepID=A0A1Y3MI06_9BACI|nr:MULTISPECIES: sugar ABC transporter substrate-binding protein [Bacillus cereus group]MDF2085579.1 sugar ABC transporter substrate-binding protein [Bacillus pseudomycoides]OUM49646.1 sugar ABC transporter substrate-binding protein [Bacillus pseudomycoides]PEE38160.1 sugar ABC transporter substrate-binding protein [Bacillus pseudomycoides]PEK69137.1 sugar ABC transporter substrate-binding protein [Bacillus pseudomycoides]PEL31436.1 sugar ABC transporter substrate-binding protein [Bacillus pse